MSRIEGGGLERVQLNLAQCLRRRGYNIRLVAGQYLTPEIAQQQQDIPIQEIARTGRFGFPSGLVRTLRRNRLPLIFTTSNDVACLVLLLRRFAFRSLRVVVTQHLSLSAPRQRARGLTRIKLELIRLGMRWLLPGADRIVAVSKALALDMHRELDIELQTIEVIHNPVIIPDFMTRMTAPIDWPWPDNNIPTIIYVGRLASVKRVDLLFTSFRELIRTCPARLLIVGTGPQENQLHEWIAENHLTDMCRMIGFTENPLPLIRKADVLVLPSDYEGFGNVLVEAMACGTQVIATDCPCGPAEILDQGVYGQLVPCGDATALEHAIQRVLNRKFRVPPETLQHRAGHFTQARATDAYQHIIDSIGHPPDG